MKLLHDRNGFNNLVPMVLAVIIVFCLLFIGGYVTGTIHQELKDSLGPVTGTPQSIESRAMNRMNNTSDNFDSAVDIVQVVVIITILAAAIGAIFLFTRYGR